MAASFRSSTVTNLLHQHINQAAGDVTLLLAEGTSLVGPATIDNNGVVTLTADGIAWLVPSDSIVAVGA